MPITAELGGALVVVKVTFKSMGTDNFRGSAPFPNTIRAKKVNSGTND